MAEAAIALFATMGTATATAGTAAAATSAAAWAAGTTITTAAGVTSSLAAAGSGALGILQGLSTATSILSTLGGGLMKMGEANTNARMAELQGNQDYIDAERNSLRIRRETAQKIGSARVAFAGSGLDISSSDAVVNDLQGQGDYETSIERNAGEMRTLQARLKAQQYRKSGSADLIGALAKGGGQAINYGIDIANRG